MNELEQCDFFSGSFVLFSFTHDCNNSKHRISFPIVSDSVHFTFELKSVVVEKSSDSNSIENHLKTHFWVSFLLLYLVAC